MAICGYRVFWQAVTALFITIILAENITAYEKTLRKIVRNKSKMVHAPFSDSNAGGMWSASLNNESHSRGLRMTQDVPKSYLSHMKNTFKQRQRSKMSTILATVDSPRRKSTKATYNGSRFLEFRLPKDMSSIISTFNVPKHSNNRIQEETSQQVNDTSIPDVPNIAVQTAYHIPNHVTFFPPIHLPDAKSSETLEQKRENTHIRDNTIVFPEKGEVDQGNNSSLIVKGIFIADPYKTPTIASSVVEHKIHGINFEDDNAKVDFLIEDVPATPDPFSYSYDVQENYLTCNAIREASANLDAQDQFSDFNIEPCWMKNTHFWNHIFDSRYEALMRNSRWPPLKVILIPRSHVDSIWRRPFEQNHSNSVVKILNNVVKKLGFYPNLTFTWNEVSHFSHWWNKINAKSRKIIRQQLNVEGRFEITTGGWVEPDEATVHVFGYVHQLIEGHQWLKYHLNYTPQVAWLTNTVTHSPTIPYLLSLSGITRLVITNLHYAWEQYLAEYQYSDFIWQQNWDSDKAPKSFLNDALDKIGNDRFPKHSVLTHFLQFNSAGFRACGPNLTICVNHFNFAKQAKNVDIIDYNLKPQAELLLEQYSKTGTTTPHNIIMAPLGGPYHYESLPELDYQYNNYMNMAAFINGNSHIYKATVEFGTPKTYFDSITAKHKNYPSIKGDFLNFADLSSGKPAYWTGFFTSRPLFKILLRRLESTLRSTEILFSFALSFNAFEGYDAAKLFEMLSNAREIVARLQDRNVVSGTLTRNAVKYVHTLMQKTTKDCWYIQEVATSLLTSNSEHKKPYLQKYVYRDGEFMSGFKSVMPGDHIYIFNSLSHERTEIVEFVTRVPYIKIVNNLKHDVLTQINPVWKWHVDRKIRISRSFFKLTFVAIIPPMTLELYKIKIAYNSIDNFATIYCSSCILEEVPNSDTVAFPMTIHPVEPGDVQLESYKYRLIFDENTGFLKTLVDKDTNHERAVLIDHGAFRSSDVNSGMFLFNTNITKPLEDILLKYRLGVLPKNVIILSGHLSTGILSIYGKILQHSVQIYNLRNNPLSNAIYVETKVDYEISPKNRELELFMSIQTDIGNGNPPQIFTDNNGFQFTSRMLNLSRRIESNMYPMTTMAFLQDRRSRLTVITDHAQGVTAFQEGQLVVMLDRRVLFNDGRGTNEGLADSGPTYHRYFILLENIIGQPAQPAVKTVQLPSLSAWYLSNHLNFNLDVFMVNPNETSLCHYTFLPLVKTSFPCDVSVLNMRVMLNKGSAQLYYQNTALMILHRQTYSCQIDQSVHIRCNGDSTFTLDKILRNMKSVYESNLSGTRKGPALNYFNEINFPSLELKTVRVYF